MEEKDMLSIETAKIINSILSKFTFCTLGR